MIKYWTILWLTYCIQDNAYQHIIMFESYDDCVAVTQTDLRDVMQEQYGVIMMRCEQTHRVSKMPKPKPRPELDFDS